MAKKKKKNLNSVQIEDVCSFSTYSTLSTRRTYLLLPPPHPPPPPPLKKNGEKKLYFSV